MPTKLTCGLPILSNVYKYLPLERIDFLKDFLIRFTPPADLNDPYECLPAFTDSRLNTLSDALKQSLDDMFKPPNDSEEAKAFAQQVFGAMRAKALAKFDTHEKLLQLSYESALKNINTGLGILSLSRRWNSALMWSHYTSSYTGFCVGFAREHEYFRGFKSESGDRSKLMPVQYSQNRYYLPDTDLTDADIDNVLLAKSSDWDYEQEERLIGVLHLAARRFEKAPYPVDLFEIPSDAISEIIVGSRASQELVEKARSAAESLKVRLYQTRTSNSSYDVERVELEV